MIRVLAAACLLLTGPAFADDTSPLKPGPGIGLVLKKCGICHTFAYIRMNSTFLPADGWLAEVTKMRQAYGAPVSDDEATQILHYLELQYGVAAK
jgi:hypothetical protein